MNDGVCRTDANDCTLRAAIEQANALENLAQPDRITFAIPGEGTKSIVADSAGFGSLPADPATRWSSTARPSRATPACR